MIDDEVDASGSSRRFARAGARSERAVQARQPHRQRRGRTPRRRQPWSPPRQSRPDTKSIPHLQSRNSFLSWLLIPGKVTPTKPAFALRSTASRSADLA